MGHVRFIISDSPNCSNALGHPGRQNTGWVRYALFIRAVRIPESIQGLDGNITDLDVIETVCYGIILDGPLSDGYEGSQSADAVSSVFTYFGSWNGVMRQYPGASYSSECGTYDPRVRPW